MSTGAPSPAPAAATAATTADLRRAPLRVGRRLDVFFGGVALMLGMAYVASALLGGYVSQARVVENLVPVQGMIDGAEVVAVPSKVPSTPSSEYSVRLHCRYAWKDQPYVTTTDAFPGTRAGMDFRDATTVAALYEPGAPTQVFVDPTNPARAVLRDTEPPPMLPIVLSLLMTVASAVLAAVGWRGWPLIITRSGHG